MHIRQAIHFFLICAFPVFNLAPTAFAQSCTAPKIPGFIGGGGSCNQSFCTSGEASQIAATNGQQYTGQVACQLLDGILATGGNTKVNGVTWRAGEYSGANTCVKGTAFNGSPHANAVASLSVNPGCIDPQPPPPPPADCAAKQAEGEKQITGTGQAPTSFCHNGCTYAESGVTLQTLGSGAQYSGNYTANGQTCTASNTPGLVVNQTPQPITDNGVELKTPPNTPDGTVEINGESVVIGPDGDISAGEGQPEGDNYKTPGGIIIVPGGSPSPPAPGTGAPPEADEPGSTIIVTPPGDYYDIYPPGGPGVSPIPGGPSTGPGNPPTPPDNDGDEQPPEEECDATKETCGQDTFEPKTGDYEFPDLKPEIDEAKQDINEHIQQIADEAQAAIGTVNSGGGGSLPCYSLNLGFFGSHTICLSDFQDAFDTLKQGVLLVCSIIAAFIVFS